MKNVLKIVLLSVMALSAMTAKSLTQPPETFISEIWAYGDNLTGQTILSHKQNNLRFFCRSSATGDSVSFRFRLDRHDRDWHSAMSNGWCFYTDLDPGQYNFMVQSRTAGSDWGPTASYSFIISTPWWLSWWAWSIYIIATAGIASYIIYVTRLRIKIHNQLLIEKETQRFRNEFLIQAGRQLRTPLTIIRTTVDKLRDSGNRTLTRTDIQHLRNSSRQLLEMIENLIMFRETGPDIQYRDPGDIIEMSDIPLNPDTLVLIVEDNPHLADVMHRTMTKYIKSEITTTAGLTDKLTSVIPDAIILDTDTTGGNAYDILHSLKKDNTTASIPVILVSAFDNSRSIMRAIKSEADDYLPKPFDCEVLAAIVIKNIKQSRSAQIIPAPAISSSADTQPILEKKADKIFIERLDSLINSNLSNPDFDILTISETLNYSRSQLYLKTKQLRGVSPVEYLRSQRLSKAAEMLRDTTISVKEIRNAVGMPDATNFNRRFKEKYGISPSDFRNSGRSC